MQGVHRGQRLTHPDRRELERFFRGVLPRTKVRAIVRHLLAGCKQCTGVIRDLWSFGDEAPEDLRIYEGGPRNQRRDLEGQRS